MYFTRTNNTLRAWFQVVTTGGTLRPGATSGSFTAVVINPSDTGAVTSSVTQSAQRPGLYYFDVPFSFLGTNGVGFYGVSVEVNITAAPKVVTAFSEVLHVTQEDWDTLSGSIWRTSASLYNVSGTMGGLQNQIGTTSISASVVVDVPQIVSGVWNANAPTFNTVNSTGWFQNKIGVVSSSLSQVSSSIAGMSASLITIANNISFISSSITNVTVSSSSISAIVNAVWNESASLYTTSGTFGYIVSGSGNVNLVAMATKISEIYQIMGLQSGSVLTVTPTSRHAAAVSQSFAGDPLVSITVTRL